jgi:phage terminase large subunit
MAPAMPPSIDFAHPDYQPIWHARMQALARLRTIPGAIEASRMWYRDHIADFINDWGVTVDPRNAGTSVPVVMPFVLFPKQREFVDFIIARWRAQGDGILVKSRDCGASWLSMSTAVSLCLFWQNVTFGFGSAKEDKVDRSGDPDCLFYKGRMFLRYLPYEFKGGWDSRRNSAHMRMDFPDSESSITGEAGDNIGRGGRKSAYFVDEFAFVERPKLVDASLVANTNCRIEMSSVAGTANVFAERARGGKVPRFDFHYRDDPRKTPEWVANKKANTDPVVWAAEYECDFLASVEGIIISQEWVQAAIGAAAKLGKTRSGERRASYDVADRGMDKNAVAARHGNELTFIRSWSGKGSDIFASVEAAFRICDELGLDGFDYDGDGMGASVRGDARKVNEAREEQNKTRPHDQQIRILRVDQFRGSAAVLDPERKAPGTDRLNKDFFENLKAQSWWALRTRFLNTWRLVNGLPCDDPENWISIDPELPELTKTCAELSQPVWTWSKSGKMVIDKTPDEVASPNNADAVMMLFGYKRPSWVFPDELMERMGA